MVVLRKIRASTLMETLVASVLIVLIFMIASMILNNLFSGTIKNNTTSVNNRLNELMYLQMHNKIEIPYSEVLGEWQISVLQYRLNNISYLEFEAVQQNTKKTISKVIHDNE